MLIFFPSYSLLNKTYDLWEKEGIINKMERIKAVYKEPKSGSKFKTVRRNFEDDAVRRGAILIGVCRGKISEGLDFSDRAARWVIVIGMPYAQWKDPRIQLKMEYLDKKNKRGVIPFTGRDWYNQESSRAVNQAIGRVIRHRYDYGLILLVDERYTSKYAKLERSKWIRDRQTNYDDLNTLISDVEDFFNDMESKNFPTKKEFKIWDFDSYEDSYENSSRRNSFDSSLSINNSNNFYYFIRN